MVVGNCPYKDCNELLMTAFSHIVAEYPKYCKHTCEYCNRDHWIRLSRVDPERWTLEEFALLYDVNEETKEITEKVNWPEEMEITSDV